MNGVSEERWGLALSGGGARGIIHVGVLQALEDGGVKPTCISGTSIGAVVGGLYAAGVKPSEMLALLSKKNWFNMFRLRPRFSGFLHLTYLENVLKDHVPDSFSELTLPFFTGATNLSKQRYEVFSDGPLHDAILASASIPILFGPVTINGDKYVDGGVMDNIPSKACKGHCDKVLGVEVNHIVSNNKLENVKDIAVEIFHIIVANNSKSGIDLCDSVIQPDLGKQFDMLDFSKNKELYEIGLEAGRTWVSENIDGRRPKS